MKVLLTGGTGYIGSHAAVVLLESGHDICLFDNLCNSSAGVTSRIESITGRTVRLICGDVRDADLLTSVMKEHGTEAVLHFAGLKAVGDSVSDPLAYYANNVQGSISLLQAMQRCQVKRIVFSSSATVYGTPQYLPYDEAHPRSSINPYGRTKLQVEEILEDLGNSDSSWSVACLRYFNPVGAHESGLIGEAPRGTPNNLMPFLVEVAAGKRHHLNVFGNDYPTRDGTGERDYIHVMDLADGHLAALNYLGTRSGFHAFNLGTGQPVSVIEMIRAFEKSNAVPVPHCFVARRDGDLPSYYADPSKAMQSLKWSATRTLEQMCTSSWNWQVQDLGASV